MIHIPYFLSYTNGRALERYLAIFPSKEVVSAQSSIARACSKRPRPFEPFHILQVDHDQFALLIVP